MRMMTSFKVTVYNGELLIQNGFGIGCKHSKTFFSCNHKRSSAIQERPEAICKY